MKGVVFTEFMDMVEQRFSSEMLDDIVEDAKLPSGGVYTAVGTYPHGEMVELVSALSARSGAAVPDLLRTFGEYLFGRFVKGYPAFFKGHDDAFTFLAGIEDVIHAEGLIVGCIAHFGRPAGLRRETIGEGQQRRERFLLERP
jgi:hypothetical protein